MAQAQVLELGENTGSQLLALGGDWASGRNASPSTLEYPRKTANMSTVWRLRENLAAERWNMGDDMPEEVQETAIENIFNPQTRLFISRNLATSPSLRETLKQLVKWDGMGKEASDHVHHLLNPLHIRCFLKDRGLPVDKLASYEMAFKVVMGHKTEDDLQAFMQKNADSEKARWTATLLQAGPAMGY